LEVVEEPWRVVAPVMLVVEEVVAGWVEATKARE